MKWITLVIAIFGIILGVVAVVYFTVPAHSLPSFLGPIPHVKRHRSRRGEAYAVGAVVLLVIAAVVFIVGRRMEAQGKSVGAS